MDGWMDGQTDRREAGKRERAGKYKKDSTKQRELWKLKPSLSLRAEDFFKSVELSSSSRVGQFEEQNGF